jgi:hypothetical protein
MSNSAEILLKLYESLKFKWKTFGMFDRYAYVNLAFGLLIGNAYV